MRIIKLGDDFKMIEKYNRIGEDIYDAVDRYMEMAYEEMMEEMEDVEESTNLKG